MTYTVVHAGTGLTGREALRGLIDDPDIELAGLLVSSPDKVGKDAGSICGRGDTGVLAHGDFDAMLRQRPDCVAYCRTAVGREEDAYREIAQLLRHGINVVTTSTIPMVYPQSCRDGAPHRGRPSLCLQVAFEDGPGERANPSLVFTAQAIVNAIPHVVDNKLPGLLEPVLGRSVVTRQARRSG